MENFHQAIIHIHLKRLNKINGYKKHLKDQNIRNSITIDLSCIEI